MPSAGKTEAMSPRQPLHPSKSRTKAVSRIRTTWSDSYFWPAETLSLTLSAGCFIAIVAILAWYAGRPAPSWPLGITLNALVSLLATIASFLVAVPLSACLGQNKWNYVRKSHHLYDFCAIQEAAAGPWQAFRLLTKGTGNALTLFAAFLCILSQALGPFVQQLVQLSSVPMTQGDDVTVQILRELPDFASTNAGFQEIGIPTRAAIYQGLFTAAHQDYNMSVSCPGNCTWPTYTTLAVCSSCTDLTAEILQVDNTSWSTPNGPSLEVGSGDKYEVLAGLTGILDVYAQSFLNVSLIGHGNNDYGSVRPRAAQCQLNFCTKTFNATSIDGVFSETLISENSFWNYTGDQATPNGTFMVGTAQEDLELWFAGQPFNFSWYYDNSYGIISNNQNGSDIWPVLQQALSGPNGTNPAFNISDLFDNMARSMTTAWRMNDVSSYKSREPVSGILQRDVVVVKIQWAWLSLPVIVYAGILALLLATMLQTRLGGMEVWKDSSVAVLAHGLDMEAKQAMSGLRTRHEMEEVSKKLNIQLVDTSAGLELSSA